MSCKLEPAIWPRDTGQRIPCFGRCQLIVALMSNIKEVHSKPRFNVSVKLFWSMAAVLRDSVAAVVVRTRPRAIPLTMITMRKSIHGFPFLSHDEYGAPLCGPSGRRSSAKIHNDNFILATDDKVFDNIWMHSWPSSPMLTIRADNGINYMKKM